MSLLMTTVYLKLVIPVESAFTPPQVGFPEDLNSKNKMSDLSPESFKVTSTVLETWTK